MHGSIAKSAETSAPKCRLPFRFLRGLRVDVRSWLWAVGEHVLNGFDDELRLIEVDEVAAALAGTLLMAREEWGLCSWASYSKYRSILRAPWKTPRISMCSLAEDIGTAHGERWDWEASSWTSL